MILSRGSVALRPALLRSCCVDMVRSDAGRGVASDRACYDIVSSRFWQRKSTHARTLLRHRHRTDARQACSWVPRLGVYKLDINQGNYITSGPGRQAQGRPDPAAGARRRSVRRCSPTRSTPTAGIIPTSSIASGRTLEHRQFTVYFVDDKVARWEGDEMPPSPAEVARSGGGDAVLDKSFVYRAEDRRGQAGCSSLLRKMGWWQ